MKKRISSMLLAIVMVVGLMPTFTLTVSAADGTTWDGSSADTSWYDNNTTASSYTINTAAEFAGFAQLVNNCTTTFSGKTIFLGADIDLDNQSWMPIANGTSVGSYSSKKYAYFEGTFDGNGNTISNLSVDNQNGISGLFGVCKNGTVKDVTVTGSVTETSQGQFNKTAGIVGYAYGTNTLISGCTNCVNVNGDAQYIGGVCAYTEGKIENCKNYGTITSTSALSGSGYYGTAGGVVGYATAGSISGGENHSTVTGKVITGGICGMCDKGTSIISCSNLSTITSEKYAGGICGYLGGSVQKCANSGDIKVTEATSVQSHGAGGIVGFGTSSISASQVINCYNVGGIESNQNAGGIIATQFTTTCLENCHSYGTVSGSGSYVGAIEGYIANTSCTVTNCYYLNGTDQKATKKTTEEFADGTVYELLQGDNTPQVWGQTIGTDSYPVFYNGSNFPHNHNWKYELVGTDTIKATCTAIGCPNKDGSVTIAAPDSLVYTGSAIEAKVIDTLKTDDTVTVVYTPADNLTDGKPVNAGAYTASITLGGKTASVDYTIEKAEATAPNGLTAVYGQKLSNVSLPNGWTWVDSTADVGDAGLQTLKANYEGDNNHNAASDVDVTVMVYQSGSTMTASAEKNKYTYGETVKITVNGITPTGEAAVGLSSLTAPITNQVAIWNRDAQLTEPQTVTGSALTFDVTGLTVGNYTLTAKFTGNENMAATSADVSVSIEQAEPNVTAPTGLTATYGDTLANVTLPTVNNGKWTWTNEETTSVGDAGTQTHEAIFTPTDTVNYKTAEVDVEVVVAKATIDSVTFSVTAPEASATPQSTVANGIGYTAAIEWYPADSTFGFNTAHTATVTLTADSNHKFADEIAVDGWDKSAVGDVLAFVKTFDKTRKAKLTELTDKPTDKTLTAYHANANSAIAELPTTVTYQTESGDVTVDIEWSCDSYNSATKATNTFSWSVKDGKLDNYDVNNIATSGTITVTNVDAQPVTNSGHDTEITYADNPFDVSTMFTKDTNAGDASYEIVVRDTEGEGAATLGTDGKTLTITKAGVITIKMTTAANGAYAAGSATATLTVKKADAAVTTAPAANSLTYTGSAQVLVTEGEATGGTMVYSLTEDGTYTEAIPTGTDAGKYTVWYYVIGDDNHFDSAKAFVDVTIAKANSSSGSGSTAYTITVKDSENGDVTANRKNASKGITVTVTVTPDAGHTLETLSVTDKNGNKLTLTDNGDGTYSFKMPASRVTVEATFMDDNTMLNFFVDVSAEDYYYDAVLWAAKNGITGGVGNNLFAPDASCTRAQIVTFLWRAAGSPEPKAASSFTDVSADAYYAKAVAWAVENGITSGIGSNLFAPDLTCTRAHAVAFLFRYAAANGMEAVTLQELVGGYGDAAQVPGYALPAFNWALAKGIVQGYNGNLMPDQPCTRAQIVTMLYRLLGK